MRFLVNVRTYIWEWGESITNQDANNKLMHTERRKFKDRRSLEIINVRPSSNVDGDLSLGLAVLNRGKGGGRIASAVYAHMHVYYLLGISI